MDCDSPSADMLPVMELFQRSKSKEAAWILGVMSKNRGTSVRKMFEREEQKGSNLSPFILNNMRAKRFDDVVMR